MLKPSLYSRQVSTSNFTRSITARLFYCLSARDGQCVEVTAAWLDKTESNQPRHDFKDLFSRGWVISAGLEQCVKV